VSAKKQAAVADETGQAASSARSEKLLAILVLEAISKKSDQDKAVLLNSVGFRNPEIAALLGTSAHTVAQHISASRKAKPPKKRPPKKR